MKRQREVKRKSALFRMRVRNHEKDQGQGFLAGIARVLRAVRNAVLPNEIDIAIGEKEERIIEVVDAPASQLRNEYLETRGREQSEAALNANASDAERLALEAGRDPALPAPFDPEERKKAAIAVEAKIRQLEKMGYRITFEPDSEDGAEGEQKIENDG